MGTNYHWFPETIEPCEHCFRPYEQSTVHIGKSSAGWCFSLNIHPMLVTSAIPKGIHTLEDWEKVWAIPGSYIENEYGEKVIPKEMLDIITKRSWAGSSSLRDPAWLKSNQAIVGPNGLARHSLLPGHCVGHGKGTWDYIIGEFF
jgi:hypothetical protein